MGKQISVVKHENSILPGFRNKISRAESTEDVKNFFVYSIQELLVNVFQDNKYQGYDAITLLVDREPYFEIKNTIMASDEFRKMWKNSDLQHVVRRLAETAVHRHWHLEKKPEKTTSKIRN